MERSLKIGFAFILKVFQISLKSFSNHVKAFQNHIENSFQSIQILKNEKQMNFPLWSCRSRQAQRSFQSRSNYSEVSFKSFQIMAKSCRNYFSTVSSSEKSKTQETLLYETVTQNWLRVHFHVFQIIPKTFQIIFNHFEIRLNFFQSFQILAN